MNGDAPRRLSLAWPLPFEASLSIRVELDISDAIFLFRYLFQGGEEAPSPFPSCGVALEGLGCNCYLSCP
jgi:hypothetical protein